MAAINLNLIKPESAVLTQRSSYLSIWCFRGNTWTWRDKMYRLSSVSPPTSTGMNEDCIEIVRNFCILQPMPTHVLSEQVMAHAQSTPKTHIFPLISAFLVSVIKRLTTNSLVCLLWASTERLGWINFKIHIFSTSCHRVFPVNLGALKSVSVCPLFYICYFCRILCNFSLNFTNASLPHFHLSSPAASKDVNDLVQRSHSFAQFPTAFAFRRSHRPHFSLASKGPLSLELLM